MKDARLDAAAYVREMRAALARHGKSRSLANKTARRVIDYILIISWVEASVPHVDDVKLGCAAR